MKFPLTAVSIGAIAAAMISAAPSAVVRADLMPNGLFIQTAASPLLHLVNSQAASDFQVAIPRSAGSCAATKLPRMTAAAAPVNPVSKKMTSPEPNTAGPIEPVVGPDGKRWLCRHDEEEQQCVCIPFVQD
jgi:hypothetical protein